MLPNKSQLTDADRVRFLNQYVPTINLMRNSWFSHLEFPEQLAECLRYAAGAMTESRYLGMFTEAYVTDSDRVVMFKVCPEDDAIIEVWHTDTYMKEGVNPVDEASLYNFDDLTRVLDAAIEYLRNN